MGHMKKTLTSFDDAKDIFIGGVNSPVRAYNAVGGSPVFIKSGKVRLLLMRTISATSIMFYLGPLLAGHANDAVISDLHNAIIKGTTFGAPTTRETSLGKAFENFSIHGENVFVNSGTEATMSAIRLARCDKAFHYCKVEGCYHGHVDSLLVAAGSGALTLGKPSSMGIQKILRKTPVFFLTMIQLHCKRYLMQKAIKLLQLLWNQFVNMGVIQANHEFILACRELTTKSGALLIFDEVMTGFRATKYGGQRVLNITPDLTCLGKVIGEVTSVYGGRTDIMNHLAPIGDVYQAGTLSKPTGNYGGLIHD